MKHRLMTLLIALAIVPFAAAGCGGDDDDSGGGDTGAAQTEPAPATTDTATDDAGGTPAPSGGATTIDIAADPGGALKFDQTELEAPAGTVTIVMDNPSDVPHAVSIEGNGVDESGEVIGKGEKSTAEADLQAGSYSFYCPVAGHEAAGMKGTLTVK